jgi:hypothetical protein
VGAAWDQSTQHSDVAHPEDIRLDDVFADSLDCFCAAADDTSARLALALAVGAQLDIPPDQVRYRVERHKPRLEVDAMGARVRVGRAGVDMDPREAAQGGELYTTEENVFLRTCASHTAFTTLAM